MAQAHYTIDVRMHGVFRHRNCGLVLAFSFSHEGNVIRLAFSEE